MKHGEQGCSDGIEIRGWRPVREIKMASKQLHAKEGKYEDEQEKQEEQRQNGGYGVHQGYHEVPQGGPVPEITHR